MPQAPEDIEAWPFGRTLDLAPHPLFSFQSCQFLSVLQWSFLPARNRQAFLG